MLSKVRCCQRTRIGTVRVGARGRCDGRREAEHWSQHGDKKGKPPRRARLGCADPCDPSDPWGESQPEPPLGCSEGWPCDSEGPPRGPLGDFGGQRVPWLVASLGVRRGSVPQRVGWHDRGNAARDPLKRGANPRQTHTTRRELQNRRYFSLHASRGPRRASGAACGPLRCRNVNEMWVQVSERVFGQGASWRSQRVRGSAS